MKTKFALVPALLFATTILTVRPIAIHAQEAAAESKDAAISGVSAAQLEKVRRQEALQRAQMMIKDADTAVSGGDYTKALTLYRDAEKLVTPNASASSEELDQIHKGKAGALYQLGTTSFNDGNYSQSLTYVNEAGELEPGSPEIQALQNKAGEANAAVEAKKLKAETEAAKVPKEISNSDFVSKQKKVLDLYRAAENYFKSEQFDEAELAYKEILKIDPYSATAYHRLRETQLAKHKKLDSAIQQTESETILDVQNGWRLPIRRDKNVEIPSASQGGSIETEASKSGLNAKLKSIVIKNVEFNDARISNAIDYLIRESRDSDPNHEGVNIILSLKNLNTPPPSNDPNAPVQTTVEPTVTLNLRNTPLLQVIKYMTSTTGLQYNIESDAIVITPKGPGRVQTRIFNVDPSVFRTVLDKTDAGAAGGGGGFTALGAGGTATRKTDVKEEFKNFGVDFPSGTSIYYNEALGVLIATHTSDVLDQIEQIILRINKTPAQVQIEAKFIDVKQGDLEELGFQWAFAPATQGTYTVESGLGTSLRNLGIGGPYLGAGNPLTAGVRDSSTVSASALDALLAGTSGFLVPFGANTMMTVTGVLTNPQVQVMVNALSQKQMTNLLSAPRITTTSGESAKILVTREFIFPSSYTDPQVQVATGAGGGNGVGIVGPSPSAFSTREIGVILEVRPTVGNDKYTISLSLSPEVIDFEGFIPYTSSALAGGIAVEFIQQQPIFNKRTITTSVTIWDGQTVLLGGLIRDDIVKVNDKVPFLGDLPFVGRLFQSKVDSDIKRNLMIFLTARIVDPAGNPIRKFDEAKFVPPAAE